ncbi:hypothetical protein FAGAP_5163 [Fusarium agapanthi]|uniref:Glycosyl hydrolases family 2 sugar binding domain-containing protein n=1 Tax=Fusarium agapanthi TaxID=1803897 RepID=A0A9P5BDQ7_9HYPO|nr:hypothetical protein FAGAP_5163 [Fusarium agapanthi]
MTKLLHKRLVRCVSTGANHLPTLLLSVQSSGKVSHPRPMRSQASQLRQPSIVPSSDTDLQKLGAGGLEFLPFYNYGFGGVNDSKIETFAFGKPAFRDVLQIALEATKAKGFSMDVALGASQGQGVPSKPLTPGLAVQLVYGKVSVKGGEKFDGALPAADINWNENLGYIHPQEKFGGNRLIGVSAAAVASSKSPAPCTHVTCILMPFQENASDESNTFVALHEKSLVHLTAYVKNGKITWTAPKDYKEYVLFAHYERYTNQRSCDGVPTDVIANGSWVTDHFSAAGAKLASQFWEKNLLSTQIRQLLKDVGKHIGYNIPLDILADVPIVSTPELESLAFKTPHQMSQLVGPTQLGRRNVISTEIGAVPQGAYSLTIPSLINLFHDAFAGGVNAMTIHGMTYTGEQLGSTWPGFTPFQYIYIELWGPMQPVWKYMGEIINYTARNQFVMQQGVAKKDLAFYLYIDPFGISDEYNGTDLRANSFTYEYLSPANFGSKASKVTNRILDSAGEEYCALVLNWQQFITANAWKKLVELADAGLPLLVVGNLPATTIGTKGQDIMTRNISKLKGPKYSNIVFIKSANDLLNALSKLSITPRVIISSDAAKDLYTMAMASFKRSSGKVSFQVSLKEGQTAIVVFTSGKSKTSIVSQSTNVIDGSYGSDGKEDISVILADAKEASLTLSNGQTKKIPASWVPGPDEAKSASVKKVMKLGTQKPLKPWSEISGAQNVSGLVTYTATFQVPRVLSGNSIAVLQFGPVLNTIRAWVNDKQLPAIDTYDAHVDVLDYLVKGTYAIKVEVASTLFNAVKARVDYVKAIRVA